MATDSRDVTGLLLAWGDGDEQALQQLIPLVHAELRRRALRYMRSERASHTLQASALVNEAYLRLADINRVRWQNRAHFFAVAARLMRRVLVDHARGRGYAKRGGGGAAITLDESADLGVQTPDFSALDEALSALEAVDERKSRVVELRFFAGLTVAETAEALGVSVETVMRDWKFARVWLLRELDRTGARVGR